MARVNLNLRIGRRGATFEARTQAFTGKLEPRFMADFQRKLGTLIGIKVADAAGKKTQEKLKVIVPKVQQEIRVDLERYARSALKFFFTRKSSTAKQDLIINLNELMASPSGFSSNFRRMQGRRSELLVWAPLAKSTMERKKFYNQPASSYFVGTGQLKSDMQTQLPKFFERVLDPGIRVTFHDVYDKNSALKDKMVRVADIELLVATQNRAGLAGVAFMRGDLTSPGPMNTTLLRNYLEDQIEILADDIIVKLENRHTKASKETNARRQRPWVEASMSFWVLNRLPAIFQSSVKKHIKDQI